MGRGVRETQCTVRVSALTRPTVTHFTTRPEKGWTGNYLLKPSGHVSGGDLWRMRGAIFFIESACHNQAQFERISVLSVTSRFYGLSMGSQ
jgi:hypothetical protein